MKLSTTREDLLAALALVTCTPRRSPMPILSQVLAEVKDTGEALLHSSDLETTQTVHLPGAWSVEPGRGMLPPKTLTDTVKALPKGSHLALTWNKEGRLTVETIDPNGGPVNSLTIAPETPDVFPQLPVFEGAAQRVELPASWLIDQISNSLLFSSVDDLRVHLVSINLTAGAGKFSLSATDGHRLYHVETPITNSEASFNAIMPRQGAAQFVKALAKIAKANKNDEVLVEVWALYDADQQVHVVEFRAPHFRHHSRMIARTFPDIYAVTPTSQPVGVLHGNRTEMHTALTQAYTIANEISRQIRLSLNGKVKLIAEDTEQNRRSEQTLTLSCFEHKNETTPPDPSAVWSDYCKKLEHANRGASAKFLGITRYLQDRLDKILQLVHTTDPAHPGQLVTIREDIHRHRTYYIGEVRVTKTEADYAEFLYDRLSNQFDIGFNAGYLLDILKPFPGETVNFEFSSATGAAVVKAPEFPDRFALVMPVRLS